MKKTNIDMNDEYAPTTMREVVYMSTGELNEDLNSFLATATLADKKWLWNYFQDHNKWPAITDELENSSLPGHGHIKVNEE